MRVAALYDIHGNLPALEAVLEDLARAAPDVVVVGGDFVLGPMPQETVQRLQALGARARFIGGNTEREILKAHAGTVPETVPWASRVRWAADQLALAQLSFLATLPDTLTVEIEGLGATLFCHGSPRSDEEILTRATSEGRLRDALDGVQARVVVCGHTHMQFDRSLDGIRVINAGSVGMPYEEEPGAYWALLGPAIELRRTVYDPEAAMKRILATRFPKIEEFVLARMAHPPRPADAVELFEKMAAERLAAARGTHSSSQ